jgi:Fur family peroxide stress response transcriptional regulator
MDRSGSAIERRIEGLMRRCRETGLNVTPQRLAVYRALLEAEDHPGPEELYRRVKRSLPSMSLATVYKALDALERLGVISQVSPLSQSKRYDANDEHHHHLLCLRCQKVVDFYDDRFDALRAPRQLGGFVAQTLTVQIKGLCTACAKKGRS